MSNWQNTTSVPWRGGSPVWLSAASTTLLLALSACSTAPPLKVDAAPVEAPRPPDAPPLPLPAPLTLLPLKFKVVTPDNLPAGKEWAFFALTPEQYENLARNQAETLRWAREAMYRLTEAQKGVEEK